MTEFAQPTTGDKEIQGNEVYEMNLALAESLDEMESQDARYKRRERFWRNGGPAIALAPLVTAGVLMATPAGHRMERTEKESIDICAIIGSFLLGAVALYGHDKNREKGQRLAEDSAPMSQALSGTNEPWIARRLAEKEADIAKQKYNMRDTLQ